LFFALLVRFNIQKMKIRLDLQLEFLSWLGLPFRKMTTYKLETCFYLTWRIS
jgi:hypothetical protein